GLLAEGPVASIDVFKASRSAGIADKTLRRAKDKLSVIASKQSLPGVFPAKAGWVWNLPPEDGQRGPSSGESELQEVTLVPVDDNGRTAWRLMHPNRQNSDIGLFATADAARQEAETRGWTVAEAVGPAIGPPESIL